MIRSISLGLIIFLGCSASFFDSHGQKKDKVALAEIKTHRKKKHESMKSAKSPLAPDDKKAFKGLHYFEPDLSYRVNGRLVRTENASLFKMKTTTSRLPDYSKYGDIYFTLHGQEYKLEVYQSPEITRMEGYHDYLFVPFTDETNGNDTYEVGRYIELRIPKGEEVTLDFNLCYNPYCSYNSNYSCPIPPEVNHLPIEIRAGEKKYKSH